MANFCEAEEVGIAPFKSPLHENGIKSLRNWREGDVVFSEIPRYIQQTVENRKVAFTCGYCNSFLGSARHQIEFLLGSFSRTSLCQVNVDWCVPCNSMCGEFYCTGRCRDLHWDDGCHHILCTGAIRDDEAESHPLIKFKIHSIQTNEVFLLVADVFASICRETDKIRVQSPTMDINSAISIAIQPLDQYVRQLWWDAAVPPSRSNKRDFSNTLKSLVHYSMPSLHH